jgi:hypothetical protein
VCGKNLDSKRGEKRPKEAQGVKSPWTADLVGKKIELNGGLGTPPPAAAFGGGIQREGSGKTAESTRERDERIYV